MAHVCVGVAFDGDQLCALRKQYRRRKPLIFAPEAGREGNVISLIILVQVNLACAVNWLLVAKELHLMPWVIPVEPDSKTGRSVAMAPSIDESHVVRDGVIVCDCVDTAAVRTPRAVSSAGGARCGLVERPGTVPGNEWDLFSWECRRNVVFTCIRFCGKINPGQVEMGGSGVLGSALWWVG